MPLAPSRYTADSLQPYSQSQVDLRPLPALRPSSPLFDFPTHSSIFTPLNDTPSPRRRTQQHRRSRSFSALSPSKTLASGLSHSPSLRVSTAPTYDPFANLNAGRDAAAAQPWRSQRTWQALHSPTLKPAVVRERPYYGEAGWRGNGAFFAGSQTNLATVKSANRAQTKALEDQGSINTPRTSRTSLKGSPSVPTRQSSLRLPRRISAAPIDWSSPSRRPSLNTSNSSRTNSCASPVSPSRRSSEHTVTSEETCHSHICTPITETPDPAYRVPSIVEAPSTPQRSSEPSPHNDSDDEDALLPPLTPKSILKSPSRSSSFAQLPVAGSTPIPWGQRGSSPHQSLSRSTTPAPPPTPQTPAPATRSRSGSVSRAKSSVPHRALPRPPPDVPNSPELDFSTFKPIFPTGQSSQKLQAAIEASRAIPRSTSQASLPRRRERSGSVLTHESSESKDSSASVRVMTPRTDATMLPEHEHHTGDIESVSALPSPNKRAGMMFARTPSPRKPSIGGRGLSSAGSSMSLASVKSVERGGWL